MFLAQGLTIHMIVKKQVEMKKQRQQTIIIITGIVIAFIISLNLVRANSLTELSHKNLATIHTTADQVASEVDMHHVVVFNNSNEIIFEIEAPASEVSDNVHLKRFLNLCDFVLSSGDFMFYHLNK